MTRLDPLIRARLEALAGMRPRPKSRQDPAVTRVVKSYRVHPDTAVAIADESRDTGLSQGQVIDRMASGLDGQSNTFSSISESGDL